MKAHNQFYLLESASKFHNTLREVFATELPFINLTCYQEVNVKELIPDYPYHNHHYDWYIKELGVILELHGAQHYKLVNYGNISAERLANNFIQMQFRDNLKMTSAIEKGYSYKVIPFTEKKKLSGSYILNLLEN